MLSSAAFMILGIAFAAAPLMEAIAPHPPIALASTARSSFSTATPVASVPAGAARFPAALFAGAAPAIS